MRKKFLVIVLCLIQIFIVFYIGYLVGKIKNNRTDELEEYDMKNSIYVSGAFASYKYIDRKINLDYFYKLDSTSTYEQIVEEIGEPNGEYGSGIIYKYYEINDDLYVSLLFFGNDECLENVSLIRLCTGKEVLDVIFPNIEELPLEE